MVMATFSFAFVFGELEFASFMRLQLNLKFSVCFIWRAMIAKHLPSG